jgi:hypothetical protein
MKQSLLGLRSGNDRLLYSPLPIISKNKIKIGLG